MYLKDIEFKIAIKLENNGNYLHSESIKLCEAAQACVDIQKKQKKEIQNLKEYVSRLPDPYGWNRTANVKDLQELIVCLNILKEIIRQ
ncbi:hypothetical protein [Flavobacterium sp. IMCC34518]|uniref:hypothetical protein n=1 Tax=Flavobacterium sp. IMCC34518 TaxID=3003623 RepID=UPI0022AC03F9|nr:hypothetical protein [Flavobacterium sp. IMCC34518]